MTTIETPLRRIVKRNFAAGHPREETLECGHTYQPRQNTYATRRRCVRCLEEPAGRDGPERWRVTYTVDVIIDGSMSAEEAMQAAEASVGWRLRALPFDVSFLPGLTALVGVEEPEPVAIDDWREPQQ